MILFFYNKSNPCFPALIMLSNQMASSVPFDLNVLTLKSRITVTALPHLIGTLFLHLKMHSRCTSALIIDNNDDDDDGRHSVSQWKKFWLTAHETWSGNDGDRGLKKAFCQPWCYCCSLGAFCAAFDGCSLSYLIFRCLLEDDAMDGGGWRGRCGWCYYFLHSLPRDDDDGDTGLLPQVLDDRFGIMPLSLAATAAAVAADRSFLYVVDNVYYRYYYYYT